MNDDNDDLKEGLMRSMSEPAKKKKKDEEVIDKSQNDWEEKFKRNRG